MHTFSRRLEDKCAIVTGGSSGIGKGIALRLAREGANVVVNYSKSEDQAEAVVEEVKRFGGNAAAIRADVSKAHDVNNLVSQTVERFGKLNILVNNAGITLEKSLMDTTEEMWDKVIDIDLKSVFLCAKRCVPEILKQGRGRIVNISSIDGLVADPYCHAYCAAKGGVIGLTRVLALELGPKGITVNAIAPGLIDTPMVSHFVNDPKAAEGWISRTPVGRLGKPEDIAAMVAFLASDESEYISGAIISVDGGSYAAGLWIGKQIFY